jgi:hypothetical protein
MARPVTWTTHALRQAAARGLPQDLVLQVATDPERTATVRDEREIRQRTVTMEGRTWLLRVVVDTGGDADQIVTAYRTSRVARYLGGR